MLDNKLEHFKKKKKYKKKLTKSKLIENQRKDESKNLNG